MLRTAVLFAALAFSSPVAPATAPRFPSGMAQFKPQSPLYPPAKYQGSAGAVVIFGNAAEIQRLCAGSAKVGPNEMILGCEGKQGGTAIIAIPNPCLMPQSDFYAAIVCHELGHVNGWRHDK